MSRYRERVIPQGEDSIALSFLNGTDSGGQVEQFVHDMLNVMWRGGRPTNPIEVQRLRLQQQRTYPSWKP